MSDPIDAAKGLWFSAQLRHVCFVDGSAKYYRDTVHLLRAADWNEAMKRALSLGRSQEREYLNANSVPARWRLKEVLTLDLLGEGVADGAEVHSQLIPVDTDPPREDSLAPEKSEPVQTI